MTVERGGCAIGALLFDLDGTLADTAPDMVAAINVLRVEQGRGALSLERLRPHVSHGSLGLLREAFGIGPGDAGFAALRARFLDRYRADLAVATRLFPEIEELLARLEARGLPWGVVTNKPGWLTRPLMAALGVAERAGCIVSGDTTAHAKPHPEPLLHASRTLAVPPDCCLFVGDAERDVRAGRDAGMRTAVALFGYIGADERPESWGADDAVAHPLELLEWLEPS